LGGEVLGEVGRLADTDDAFLIFDEVQTGLGSAGKMWSFEHFGVVPDAIAFGKKVQMGGCWVGPRVDEVQDNVFKVVSRINSTWGGNLTDMVRSTRILEIMQQEKVVEASARTGERLLRGLQEVCARHADVASNPRGRGLMVAFDLPDKASRDALRRACFDAGMMILGCGEGSFRFRPALVIGEADVDEGLEILDRVLGKR